mmetsp:Transcript_6951/g.10955  ORF Transcript_6951/g.10955 Transcript_6951/m.10955 type:complete len:740 (-) Transcript_6951:340-2559(-)
MSNAFVCSVPPVRAKDFKETWNCSSQRNDGDGRRRYRSALLRRTSWAPLPLRTEVKKTFLPAPRLYSIRSVLSPPVTRYDLQSASPPPSPSPSLLRATTSDNLPAAEYGAYVYDADELIDYFAARPGQVLARLAAVGVHILQFMVKIVTDKQTGSLEKNERQRARELKEVLTLCGPAFVKVGQALSTRPDLVPQAYIEELAEMQDQLPPFPDEQAFQLIELDTGRRIQDMYLNLSPKAVAAASLGQVYKGQLPNGDYVAVKVQRPGLTEGIALDIYIARQMAQIAQNTIEFISTDLVAVVDEFATRIFEELNYVQEGHNAERFAECYGSLPGVKVPRIYWECSSTRVLTMEWIEGVKLSNQKEIRARGKDPIHYVNIGIECTLRQLFEYGFFHADPHPGNLLACEDDTLAFLDFGMMAEAPQSARYALMAHIVHLVNRDYEEMAQDYYRLGFLDPSVDVSPIVPALAGFFGNVLETSVTSLNFKTIVDGLGEVFYKFPFKVPPYYALILRSLTVLEGLAMATDPSFKVIAKAYPYVARQLLTNTAPELREALEQVLFKDGQFRWNRLENLVRESRKTYGSGTAQVVEQGMDYLFSDAGSNLRNKLTVEATRAIDLMSLDVVQTTLNALPRPPLPLLGVESMLRLPSLPLLPSLSSDGSSDSKIQLLKPEDEDTVERIKHIATMLSESPADPQAVTELLSHLVRFLQKDRNRDIAFGLTQEIAGGLAQRVAARTIRMVLS